MYIDEIENRVKSYLSKALKKEVDRDTPILSSGLLSSLFAMQIVLFIEKEFNITISNSDLNLSNFDSIAAITHFVYDKLHIQKIA